MRSFANARIKCLIPVLLFSFFFTTCKKNDVDDQLDAYFSDRYELQPIRLFTASGEIQEQDIVSDFINRHRSNSYFHIFITNLDTIMYVAGVVNIEYLSVNTAKVTSFNQSSIRDVIEKDNLLYFEASDTTSTYHPIGVYGWLYDFVENSSTYKPFYYEYHSLPLSTGWQGITESRHCYFLQKKNGELSYPYCYFVRVRYNHPGMPGSIGGAYNNEFNTEAYQYLTEGDTLVVQQSAIILKYVKI